MPITKRNGKYYWGSKGPFDSRKKAAEVAQAAHASGYEGSVEIEKILPLVGAVGALGLVTAPLRVAGGLAAAAKGAVGSVTGGSGGEAPEEMSVQDAHSETEWENIHRSKSMQKLMSFVQIQKIGYPDPKESYPKGMNMQQSAGIPSPESKDGQRIGAIARKMQPDDYDGDNSPLHVAHSYTRLLQDDMGGTPADDIDFSLSSSGGRNTHPDIGMHLAGHQAIATVHNILNFGEDYLNHPDAINYRRYVPNPDYGRGSTQQWLEEPQLPNAYKEPHGKGMGERVSLENFHRNLLRANMHPTLSHNAAGMADDLHRRIRQTSPAYHPDDISGYNKLQAPGSWETSFAESAPLPPEGEGEGDVSTEEMLLPRGIPYDRGDAFPKDRYGRWYRETMPNMTPRSSGTSGSTTLHRYPSMRGRREAYKDPDEQLSSQAATIRDYPSQNRSRYAPEPTTAFERRFPDLYDNKEKSMSKLMKFIRKEGAVGGEGGGFDGLSGTVFTSTNAGIFTPTYGGKGTKRKHRKNRNRQDKRRRKLMGKEKKSGVERLVQYLYDGSPHMSKAGKMGLAPGLDDDMTGDGATAHAWNNKPTQPAILNHKKTSRPLEDATEVATDNEPHISMGQPGGFETGTLSTYPQHSNVNAVGNAKVQPGPNWGQHKAYVQKAVPQATTFISPNGHTKAADGQHPQEAFIERTKDNPNEAPHKDAVIKENDMQRKRKQESNTEPEGSQPVAGLGLQMSSFGMNTYEQDALARGGEEDESHDEEDIDETNERTDEEGNIWVPMNPDRTKALESMRKALEDAGDEAPLLTALYKLDYN